MRSIPCVSSHTVFFRHGQPAITRQYQFSDANFLGGAASTRLVKHQGITFIARPPGLPAVLPSRLMSGDRVHRFVVRTYNKFGALLI